MRYFDTSVIILAISKDSRREIAIRELSTGGITSELGFVELVSYLSRNLNDNPLPYAIRILDEFNIEVKSVPTRENTPLGEIGRVFSLALEIASKVKLRTLDLLHVSYAILLNADKIVTADKEFEKAKDFLLEKGVELNVIV